MSSLQDTLAQYDARLRELEEIRKARYARHELIQAEKREVAARWLSLKRRAFFDLVNDKGAFTRHCYAEMGVAREEFPSCFCRHHDIMKRTLDEKFRSLYMGIGIKTEDVLFPTHPGLPSEPIYDLISRQRGCYTIDDCLEALHEHMKQLLASESR